MTSASEEMKRLGVAASPARARPPPGQPTIIGKTESWRRSAAVVTCEAPQRRKSEERSGRGGVDGASTGSIVGGPRWSANGFSATSGLTAKPAVLALDSRDRRKSIPNLRHRAAPGRGSGVGRGGAIAPALRFRRSGERWRQREAAAHPLGASGGTLSRAHHPRRVASSAASMPPDGAATLAIPWQVAGGQETPGASAAGGVRSPSNIAPSSEAGKSPSNPCGRQEALRFIAPTSCEARVGSGRGRGRPRGDAGRKNTAARPVSSSVAAARSRVAACVLVPRGDPGALAALAFRVLGFAPF